MSIINDYLNEIASASYGSDVRDAIVASIRECYKDATGHPDSVAALVQEYIDREENMDDKVSLLTGLYNSIGDITYSYAYINHPIGLTVSNNEFACIDQITLGPGKWIIKAASYFYDPDNLPNNPARRSIYLSLYNTLNSTTNKPVCIEDREDDFSLSTSGYRGDVVTIRMMHLTEKTTIYLWASCSGAIGSVELTPYMTAMKIGEATPSDGTTIADQVVANTEDISILDEKVTTNISSISTLESDVDTLEEDVNDIEDEIADLKSDLEEYAIVKRYNNILTPTFEVDKSCASTIAHNVISDTISVEAGKTYFGYCLVNISNLTGYVSGYLYLRMFNSLAFVLNEKYAGNSSQPLANGLIELYGTFTPTSNGTVYAELRCQNQGDNHYTFTANVEKLYLFESDNSVLNAIQNSPYTNPLVYRKLKDNIIEFENLSEEVQGMLIQEESNIIDCWGDSLTAGAGSTSVTYPSRLQTLIGENFTVNNYGQGSETAEAVAFRQGALDGIVEPFTASTNYVILNSLKSVNDGSLSALNFQGVYYGNNIVSINGVNYFYRRVDGSHCQLARISGSSNPTYTRPMLVKAEGKGIHHIIIICVGQNGWVNNDPTTLASIIQNMIMHNDYDKYIIVGIPTGNASNKATEEQTLGSIFGNHFVNAREYISEWGCSDNNITPTTEDTEAMSIGAIPPSLKSDGTHLNDYGYTAMGNCIYQRGVSLGYWN